MLSLLTICYFILCKMNVTVCNDVELKYKSLIDLLECNFYYHSFYTDLLTYVIKYKISDFNLFEYNNCWILYAVFNKLNCNLAKLKTEYSNPKIIFNYSLTKYQIFNVYGDSNIHLSVSNMFGYNTYLSINKMNSNSADVILIGLNEKICEQSSIINNLLLKNLSRIMVDRMYLDSNQYIRITVMK